MARSRFVVKDHTQDVLASLEELAASRVLVGIPEEKAPREDEEDGGPINNAALGYIHENGSPSQNIPARPWLIPGADLAKPKVAKYLSKAAVGALEGDRGKMMSGLHSAGITARDEVMHYLNTADFPPLADSTLRARAQRSGSAVAAAARRELASRAMGNPPGIGEARPLIETGQMRDAITYVITDE